MEKNPKGIVHDLEVGINEINKPLWRSWGYSKLIAPEQYHLSSSCDFCKKDFGINNLYHTKCYCGNHGEILSTLKLNAIFSPDDRVYNFYCCVDCMPKITKLVQQQDRTLLNHEILINVVKEMMNEFEKK